MKSITEYEAFDGKRFDSADTCKAYEAEHAEARVVGLTIEQIRAAIAREDIDLADALETIGTRCATARREAGVLRRKPKEPEVAQPASKPAAPPAKAA